MKPIEIISVPMPYGFVESYDIFEPQTRKDIGGRFGGSIVCRIPCPRPL